jgi:hypothetical protein
MDGKERALTFKFRGYARLKEAGRGFFLFRATCFFHVRQATPLQVTCLQSDGGPKFHKFSRGGEALLKTQESIKRRFCAP